MTGQVVGTKIEMTQKFTSKGKRIVVTKIKTEPEFKLGSIFNQGDRLKVTGCSKGKGFTGVMKRWGFSGGPRTHGQSDRQRAPGSIGQSATPGRVFPGKKMPGRAGGKKVTISSSRVFEIDEENNLLLVTGPVPGARNSRLVINIIKKSLGDKADAKN
ncbi:50S ribosomal protein L3 [Patescibacteria group bacterium]